MKVSSKVRTKAFSSVKRTEAKKNILKSTLVSFKIEGVQFSPAQIKSVQSRLHLAK